MRSFRIVTDVLGDTASVALVGELDMAEVETFERELRRIEASGPELLLLDLAELTVIDSHGLSALIGAEQRARADRRRLVLTPASEPVMQVFRITLLDRRFDWVDSLAPNGPERSALQRVRDARDGAG